MDENVLRSGFELQGGKYRITGLLGQGGFGITYEAEQVALGRKVAIKEFFMKGSCEREADTASVSVPTTGNRPLVARFKDKFIREARLIAAMDHPHIVKIHDIFEENGTAYYVMESIQGGSLSSLVKTEGPLPEEVALEYIRQIGDALGYVHRRKVLHLDVKPSNILLRKEEASAVSGDDENTHSDGVSMISHSKASNAVLIDFGISKHYDEAGQQTSSTPVGISVGYAPNEQYRAGDVGTFTPATDVYSLGATLYYLVTATVPPAATDVLNDGLTRPFGISDVIWHAIERAMAPRVKDRPQSVEEFLKMLSDKPLVKPAPARAPTEDEETLVAGAPVKAAVNSPKPSSSQKQLSPAKPANSNALNKTDNKKSDKPSRKTTWIALVAAAAVALILGFILLGGGNSDNNTESSDENTTLVADNNSPEQGTGQSSTNQGGRNGDDNSGSAPAHEPTFEIVVSSTPSGAKIFINGKDQRETTPATIKDLKAGTYKVTLKLEGYEDQTKSVTFKSGSTSQSKVNLTLAVKPQQNTSSSGNNGVYTVNGATFKMVYVSGGTFTMGATSEQGSNADDKEKPTHSVTLNGYWIGETEVTQELWQAVMGNNPSRFTENNQCPVEKVSYDDCKTFISKLNSLTNKNFRLPTEAEWEFAARGGNSSKGYKYSGSNNIGEVAWYDNNSGDITHPVKTKRPNELGLYDMSGNVWEWCNDWYGEYSSSAVSNPRGTSSGSSRVLRGGSWARDAWFCRVSCRYYCPSGYRDIILGLRLAL